MSACKYRFITIPLDEDLFERLREEAGRQGRSRSDTVRRMIDHWLEHEAIRPLKKSHEFEKSLAG